MIIMAIWKITFPVKDLPKKKQKHMGNLGFGGHKVTRKVDLDYLKEHFRPQGFYPKGSKLQIDKFKSDLRGKPIKTTKITAKGRMKRARVVRRPKGYGMF